MPWDDIARIEHRRDTGRYPSDLTDREWSLIGMRLRSQVSTTSMVATMPQVRRTRPSLVSTSYVRAPHHAPTSRPKSILAINYDGTSTANEQRASSEASVSNISIGISKYPFTGDMPFICDIIKQIQIGE
jgi:hypothetical protein